MESQEKMNAEIVELGGDTCLVVAKPTGFRLAYPNVVIKIEGAFSSAIAKGVVRMLNENQCANCGKFNGLHGEIFHVTDMDNGEVNGRYEMCPLGKAVQR